MKKSKHILKNGVVMAKITQPQEMSLTKSRREALMRFSRSELVSRLEEAEQTSADEYHSRMDRNAEVNRLLEEIVKLKGEVTKRDNVIRNLHQCLESSARAIADYAGVVTHLKLGE